MRINLKIKGVKIKIMEFINTRSNTDPIAGYVAESVLGNDKGIRVLRIELDKTDPDSLEHAANEIIRFDNATRPREERIKV